MALQRGVGGESEGQQNEQQNKYCKRKMFIFCAQNIFIY
jgi:hypothetical protein